MASGLQKSVQDHFDQTPIRHKKGERNAEMEAKIADWIMHVVGEDEKPQGDFAKWIQDGCVLSKVMHSIVFNSIPAEDINETRGSNPQVLRVKELIREMHKYGVKDVFCAEDLLARRDIGKVTRNLVELSELAEKDKGNLLNKKI